MPVETVPPTAPERSRTGTCGAKLREISRMFPDKFTLLAVRRLLNLHLLARISRVGN